MFDYVLVFFLFFTITRAVRLLDALFYTSPSNFSIALWRILLASSSARLPASSYLLSHLVKGNTDLAVFVKTSVFDERIEEHEGRKTQEEMRELSVSK